MIILPMHFIMACTLGICHGLLRAIQYREILAGTFSYAHFIIFSLGRWGVAAYAFYHLLQLSFLFSILTGSVFGISSEIIYMLVIRKDCTT